MARKRQHLNTSTSDRSRKRTGVDHAIFVRNIADSLKNGTTKRGDFMDSLLEFVSDPLRFQLVLMPTETSTDECVVSGGPRDSLIRLLLTVDSLQTDIVLRLLDGLREEMDNTNRYNVNLSELIISQLRFLDHVVDCMRVSAKVQETLPHLSPSTQKALIPCIPELLTEEFHRTAALDLQTRMEEDRTLTSCVLSTLGRLQLDSETTQEARVVVVDELSRGMYTVEQLPDVICFLLDSSGDPPTAQETFLQLRDNLDMNVFSSDPTNLDGRPSSKRAKREEMVTPGGGILGCLQSSARFPMKKHLGDGMMRALDYVDSEEGKPFDVLLCLVMLNCPNRKKRAERELRHRIHTGFFTPQVFGETLKLDLIRKEYFKKVVEIAESLLQSSEPALAGFASSLYKHSFKISRENQLDELVVGLVSHVGSFSDSEIKWALRTLKDMIADFPEEMDRLSFYVTDLLGSLSDLSYENAKSVLEIVVDLGLKASDPADTTLEDLHRLINKKNMAACKKSRMMGLLGGLMLVKNLLPLVDECGEKLEEAEKMISFLDTKTLGNRALRTIWFHELSQIFGSAKQGRKVAKLLLDKFGSECDTLISSAANHKKFDFETCVDFDLRKGEEEMEICPVDMAGLVMNEEGQGGSAVVLPPLLRLLTASCQVMRPQGDLEKIRWALVAPLKICSEDAVDDFGTLSVKTQGGICAILYHSSNWLREILNSFGGCPGTEETALIARLKHTREVDRRLMLCLKKVGVWSVPVLSLGYTDVSPPLIGRVQQAPGKLKKKKPPKGPNAAAPHQGFAIVKRRWSKVGCYRNSRCVMDTQIEPPAWKEKFSHLPEFRVQKNFKLVSAPDDLPPGTFTYWVSRGQVAKLALKEFQFVKNSDETFHYDHQGKASIKVRYPRCIEVTPEVAIRVIKVWSEMLVKEGFDLDV